MSIDSLAPKRSLWHLPGDRIAKRYEIGNFLGEGATAQVYKAYDTQQGVDVVLKKLNPYLETDSLSVERFRRELMAARKVGHPQVVAVYDLVTIPEGIYLIMEYIRGIDIKQHLRREGHLPIAQGIEILRQTAEILSQCHRQGLIHRDLKPQNLILSQEGVVHLVDFGIAKISALSDLTRTGTLLGSPEYMAPEIFSSYSYDLRTDIYALGIIGYEMLTGTLPFVSDSMAQLAHQQVNQKPNCPTDLRADIPAWLTTLIMRCLEKRPIDRYQGCDEILWDIRKNAITADKFETRAYGLCLACKAQKRRGLPFCPRCGLWENEIEKPGNYNLRLHQSKDVDQLLALLKRIFTHRLHPKAERSIRRKRPLLIKGLDQKGCELLAAHIKVSGSSVVMEHRGVQTALAIARRIGFHYFWTMTATLAILVSVFFAPDLSLSSMDASLIPSYAWTGSCLGHLLFVGIAALVIRDETTAVLMSAPDRQSASDGQEFSCGFGPLAEISEKLKAVQSEAARDLMAQLIGAYHEQIVRLSDSSDALDSTALNQQTLLMHLAIRLSLGISEVEQHLEARGRDVRPEDILFLQEKRAGLLNRLIAIVSETRLLAGLRLAWEEPFTQGLLDRVAALAETTQAELEVMETNA